MIDHEKLRQKKKFSSTLARKDQLAMWQHYYLGNQKLYLRQFINRVYEDDDNRSLLLGLINTKGLTKSIIQKESLLFLNGVSFTIAGNEDATNKLRLLLNQVGIHRILENLNNLTNLFHDTHVLPKYIELLDKIKLLIITPLITFVELHLYDATKAEQIMYIINEYLSSNKSNLVNTVRVWTDLYTYKGKLNNDGNVDRQQDIKTNPYGYIPLVHFSDSLRRDKYFSTLNQLVVDRNLSLNLMWTMFLAAYQYQSLSTLVVRGDLKALDIPNGLSGVIVLPNSALNDTINDINYIIPDTDVVKLNDMCQSLLVQTALLYNISALSYKSTSTANSGYQLKLQKQDLINRTKADIPLYEDALKLLVKTIMDTLNIYQNGTWTSADKEAVVVTINPPSILLSEDLVLNNYSKRLSINLTSPIRILMLLNDIDILAATKLYNDIVKLNNQTIPLIAKTDISELI